MAQLKRAVCWLAILLAGFSAHGAVTTNLVFTTQPVGAQVGASLGNVAVQLRDSRGTNISLAGVPVTISLSGGSGILVGVMNVATDTNGKSIFTNLSVSQVGSGKVLQAKAGSFNPATSSAFSIRQGLAATVLIVPSGIITYGQPIALSAAVTVQAPASGKPTGSIAFRDGSTVLGTVGLNSQTASFTISSRLPAGNHSFSAVYSGDTNFASSLSAFVPLTIAKLALTVSGITASNKVYDAKPTATLVISNAAVSGVLAGDNAVLNTGSVRGNFSDKNIGTGKIVAITGLLVSGTNSANYSVTPPTATANILPASLTIVAHGVNRYYDGTASATVTLTDNRFNGDVLTDSYALAVFTNKNIGSGKTVFVSGLTISGTDAANYLLNNTNAATTASIVAATVTVSGITASNKIYDAKTVAALNVSAAVLNGAVGGDLLTLNATNAKGTFANKNVGANKTVAITGLALAGTNAANYSLTQPVTTASITPASLTVTAKGANKIYDGSTNVTVTMLDNRFAGDVLTGSYVSAGFANSLVGTNKFVGVSGIKISGTDAPNYNLQNTNAATVANITLARLLVQADNLSRPFGITNPPLTFSISGFVNSETLAVVTGAPLLTTIATTNSPVGVYPIKISTSTLTAVNYTFASSNGVLTVVSAGTVALVTSALNPARTNQNITFVTRVSALNPGVPAPSGQVRFKCNGTNSLGAPVSLTNGATTVVIPAAIIASSSSVLVTAEFSDPAGNFNSSSNTITQTIVISTPPPSIGKVSITPPKFDGTLQATLTGTPGQAFVLEASSDLIHWTPVSTNIADTNGIATLVESNAIAYPSRFYRGRTAQ